MLTSQLFKGDYNMNDSLGDNMLHMLVNDLFSKFNNIIRFTMETHGTITPEIFSTISNHSIDIPNTSLYLDIVGNQSVEEFVQTLMRAGIDHPVLEYLPKFAPLPSRQEMRDMYCPDPDSCAKEFAKHQIFDSYLTVNSLDELKSLMEKYHNCEIS